MSRKKLTHSVSIFGIVLILFMFINIASTIYNQTQKIDQNSTQIVSAFDG